MNPSPAQMIWHKVKLRLWFFVRQVAYRVFGNPFVVRPMATVSPSEGPVFFVMDGAPRSNGGVKLCNVWVRLLRDAGVDAFLVTPDGQYVNWLIDHQPVISLAEFDHKIVIHPNARIVVTWLNIVGLDRSLGGRPFYYFDAELAWTLKFRHHLRRFLRRGQIANVGTPNRYIAGWYMSQTRIKPHVIHEWSDTRLFANLPTRRIPGRIGAFLESDTERLVWDVIQREVSRLPNFHSAVQVKGTEVEVRDLLQTIDIFVGLNPGENPLWGEGCPRTQQEAMHCGCVVVAFDVLGNQEYIDSGWNGQLVRSRDAQDIAKAVRDILRSPEHKETLRAHSLATIQANFSEVGKLELVREFLGLG